MTEWLPSSAGDVAAMLHEAAGRDAPVRIEGAGSKRSWGGPPNLGTLMKLAELNRVIEYEPRDLTICLEAGVRIRDIGPMLAAHGQMLPLDPPYCDTATIGGVVSAGMSGPRRRLYGGIRDQIIGMVFATVDGTLVNSGGKVVKNVAGLDMQKAFVGSYGTLGVITQINFKLTPMPVQTRTFVVPSTTNTKIAEERSRILAGPLQPAAIDAVNAEGASALGLEAVPSLLVRANGTERVLARYGQELPGASHVEGEAEKALWRRVEAFCEGPRVVAQAGHGLPELAAVMDSAPAEAIARAGNGVAYLGFSTHAQAAGWLAATNDRSWSRVIAKAPIEDALKLDLWPSPGPDLELMRRLKATFDPHLLLNKGRLHGRI